MIFDLDDTLCDYSTRRAAALRQVFDEFLPDGFEAATRTYERHEPGFFAAMLDGSLSPAEYRRQRFLTVLQQHGDRRAGHDTSSDGVTERMNERYMYLSNELIRPVNGMSDHLRAVRASGLATAVLTNGPSDGQRMKIAALGIGQLVDAVHISQECGVAKPNAEAFLCVLRGFGALPAQAVMIGDDRTTDIEGARAAGLHAIEVRKPGAPAAQGHGLAEAVREALLHFGHRPT